MPLIACTRLGLVFGLLLAASLPSQASAQSAVVYEYFDAHPTPGPPDADVVWCLEDGRHGHDYALDPDQEPIYNVDGVRYYVGDSVVRGSPVEAVWYWGAHPLLHMGSAWCVLDGPHAHYWRPWWKSSSWRSSSWVQRDGYWNYAGPYDDGYRWSYDRWYVRHHALHTHRLSEPRYPVRYRSARHPGVVYEVEQRPLPRWDYRTYRQRSGTRDDSQRRPEEDPRRRREGETGREKDSRRDRGDRSRGGGSSGGRGR